MFLHLGKNVVVPLKEVIVIIDINCAAGSKYTQEFIKVAEEEGFVKKISEEQLKSLIITEKVKKNKQGKNVRESIIYFSPISSTTLYKRAEFIREVSIL